MVGVSFCYAWCAWCCCDAVCVVLLRGVCCDCIEMFAVRCYVVCVVVACVVVFGSVSLRLWLLCVLGCCELLFWCLSCCVLFVIFRVVMMLCVCVALFACVVVCD